LTRSRASWRRGLRTCLIIFDEIRALLQVRYSSIGSDFTFTVTSMLTSSPASPQ
jgi:hypothetical protein